GSKTSLINRILRTPIADHKRQLKKRQLDTRIVEQEHINKKRKIEKAQTVTLCKIQIPREIAIHILKHLTCDKHLLNGIGLVDSEWYNVVRGEELWSHLRIADKFEYLPIPM